MSAPLADLNVLPLPRLYELLAEGGSVRRLLELARDEDLGPLGSPQGDITTQVWAAPGQMGVASLAARSAGIVAGLATAPLLLELFAPQCVLDVRAEDGHSIRKGETIAMLRGPLAQMLCLERTLLNVIGRLSGVATAVSHYIEVMSREAPGSKARICDTRKTTPGLRSLEKYAVRCGGGHLHRLGLYDAVLLKDNHLSALEPAEMAQRVAQVSAKARSLRPLRFVEVEVDSLAQLEALMALPVGTIDIVLLDNMHPPTLREAVKMRDGAEAKVQLEASGGVSLETVGPIARSGVDRISVGAITHSAPALDVGLDMLGER